MKGNTSDGGEIRLAQKEQSLHQTAKDNAVQNDIPQNVSKDPAESIANNLERHAIDATNVVLEPIARKGEGGCVFDGDLTTFQDKGHSRFAFILPEEMVDTCRRWEIARQRATMLENELAAEKTRLSEASMAQATELGIAECRAFDLQEEIKQNGKGPSPEQQEKLKRLLDTVEEKERDARDLRERHCKILEKEFDCNFIAEQLESKFKSLFCHMVKAHQWCDSTYVPPSPLFDLGPRKPMDLSKHKWPWECFIPQSDYSSVAGSKVMVYTGQNGGFAGHLRTKRVDLRMAKNMLEEHRATYDAQYRNYAVEQVERNSKTIPDVESEFGPIFLQTCHELSRKIQDVEEALEQAKLEVRAANVIDYDQESNFAENHDVNPDWDSENIIRRAQRKRERIQEWVDADKLWLRREEPETEARASVQGPRVSIPSVLEPPDRASKKPPKKSSSPVGQSLTEASQVKVYVSHDATETPHEVRVTTDDRAPPQKELDKYVQQEGPSVWRCKVEACNAKFLGYLFWKEHAMNRHGDWYEGLRKRALDPRSGHNGSKGPGEVRTTFVSVTMKRKSNDQAESNHQTKKQKVEHQTARKHHGTEISGHTGRKRKAVDSGDPAATLESSRKKPKNTGVEVDRPIQGQAAGDPMPASRKRKARDELERPANSESGRKKPKTQSGSGLAKPEPVDSSNYEQQRRLNQEPEQWESVSAVEPCPRFIRKIRAWNDAVRKGHR
ncbi:hypothetical protein K491DRAFT_347635 [Lophiostoma macrostomum CBS 122681]|uniref:C2H2-type domain-containing protein n=1 Tax=Lophiostoma macrostomum CBS 122681 TaxID=1314788 RepID=A0A6A6SKC5_9PLEO|nr:hypothetical protein K491DRAFT_347635 [Lophiostoma macrostomum CBS 122681]